MNYAPKWERFVLMFCMTGIAAMLIFFSMLFLPISEKTVRALLAAVALFLLFVTQIAIMHSYSTFEICNGKFVHLRFSKPIRSFDVTDIVKLEIAKGMLPGKFTFIDGSEVLVSGIALGNDDRLEALLRSNGIAFQNEE